jgi:hypothetical protein
MSKATTKAFPTGSKLTVAIYTGRGLELYLAMPEAGAGVLINNIGVCMSLAMLDGAKGAQTFVGIGQTLVLNREGEEEKINKMRTGLLGQLGGAAVGPLDAAFTTGDGVERVFQGVAIVQEDLILTLFEDAVTQPADVEYEHETSTTKD